MLELKGAVALTSAIKTRVLKWIAINLFVFSGIVWTGAVALSAAEDRVAAFYRGKTLTILVGYSAGGGYDLYARLLARHIARHIPGNPTVIVQNMPGAASIVAANHLFNVAPKDGTVIGTFARGLPVEQLKGSSGVQFDAARFNWIGSMNEEVGVCVARTDSGIQRFDDLFERPLRVGGAGPASDDDVYPRLLNALLGTKFQLVSGYPGGNEITLAIERNEVQGRCTWSWSSLKTTRPDWVEGRFIRILAQIALRKYPELPNVPLVIDYAKDDATRKVFRVVFARQTMGRPFAAPPGVPTERVMALRRAFSETLRDPQFLSESGRGEIEINNPMSGEELQELVAEIMSAPPTVVQLIKQYL